MLFVCEIDEVSACFACADAGLMLVREDRQFVAAPRAASLEHVLSVGRLHPQAESMYAQAAAVLGLKGSFHDFFSWLLWPRRHPSRRRCGAQDRGIIARRGMPRKHVERNKF